MTVAPPRTFISYSHDSAEHKKWVLEFATTLRNRGIDAILDQWDLKPGDDVPHFMEQNLTNADYAVMICTKRYVTKANAGEGGVGYEKMIMTSASLSNISASKVIPILREKGNPPTPTFLATKLYIDFTNDSEIEFALDDLLRRLLNAPLYRKPEVGHDPFRPLEKVRPEKTADGVRDLMTDIAKTFDNTQLNYIIFSNLLSTSKLRRLTIDKYLIEAENRDLIERQGATIRITMKGKSYLNENGIVEA